MLREVLRRNDIGSVSAWIKGQTGVPMITIKYYGFGGPKNDDIVSCLRFPWWRARIHEWTSKEI